MESIWAEIIIRTPAGYIERAEAALHMATPLGLYIEDYSDLESGLQSFKGIDLIEDELLNKDRETALLHVYFPPGSDREKYTADIRKCLQTAGFCEVSYNYTTGGFDQTGAVFTIVSINKVCEEDWANNWKRYFKPLRVGKSILIKPEWEEPDIHDSQLLDGVKAIVSIDPGMAFGTGSHATTKLCLELIEMWLGATGASNSECTANVLDIGCGSGILSIAAVLLGARSALGIDIDDYAVRNARENAAINGVTDRVRFQTGDLLGGVSGRFELVVANIVADVVIGLLRNVGRHLSPGGAIVLSGIIDDRENDVVSAAAGSGFTVAETLRAEGWTALLLRQTVTYG